MQGWAREESQSTTIAVGIDVAKAELVVALTGLAAVKRYDNDFAGRGRLVGELTELKKDWMLAALKVGLEASGGYERKTAAALRKAGFEVIVFQPARIKAFARYLGQQAKTDPLDARVIACAAAAYDGEIRQSDDRLAPMAEHLTFIEQIEDDIVRLKTRRDGFSVKRLQDKLEGEIEALKERRSAELKALCREVQAHADLAKRLNLVTSIQGIGERTGLMLVIRMPELGAMSREEAASLAGLAPFDQQSGNRDAIRHIQGGRARVRRSLYAAALPAAFRWNPALVDLYQRLIAKGRNHKQALVACARKLVIFANTVLARGTPWLAQSPGS